MKFTMLTVCFISMVLTTCITLINGQAATTTTTTVAPIRTEILTREGFFPLWWSQASYVGSAIVLGYTFFGLLALYAYRNWVYDDAVGYRGFQQDSLGNINSNLDEIIREFGEKFESSK